MFKIPALLLVSVAMLSSINAMTLVEKAQAPVDPQAWMMDGTKEWKKWMVRRHTGAQLSQEDIYKRTALMVAAKLGDKEFVQRLFDKGATDIQSSLGYTALMWASEEHAHIVAMLLEHDSAVLNVQDGIGMTALMWAAGSGNLASVEHLLDRKPLLDLRDRKGRTALMWAVACGNTEIAQLLISQGAQVFPEDSLWAEEIAFAEKRGGAAAVELIKKHGVDQSN